MLKKLLSRLLIIAIFSMVALILVLNIRQLIVCTVVKTDMLRAMETRQTVCAEILLIKEERVVTAPVGGQVNMLFEQGKRVRVGEKIAEITSGDGVRPVAVYSPVSGIVQEIDGLENILTGEMANVIDVAVVFADDIARPNERNSETPFGINKGQPFCKIVDNLEPINCIAMSKNDEKIFSETGKNVTIICKGYNVQAEVQEDSDRTIGRAVLCVNNYPCDFALLRQAEVEVVTGNTSGLLVNDSSLVPREDEQGLFVVRGLRATWEPVNILGKVGESSIIEGELLEENDLYVVNPFLVREGDRI